MSLHLKKSFKKPKNSKENKLKTTKNSNLKLKNLNPFYFYQPIVNQKKPGQITDSKEQLFFQRIEESLVYPTFLSHSQKSGFVNVCIFISQKDGYLENASTFSSSNPYLRVYVAQLLRKHFAHFSHTDYVSKEDRLYRATFEFELTSLETNKASNIEENQFYFYRKAWGAVSRGQEIYKRSFDVLGVITSPLTLLNFFNSDSEKLKNQRLINEFKKDSQWKYD